MSANTFAYLRCCVPFCAQQGYGREGDAVFCHYHDQHVFWSTKSNLHAAQHGALDARRQRRELSPEDQATYSRCLGAAVVDAIMGELFPGLWDDADRARQRAKAVRDRKNQEQPLLAASVR